MVEITQADIVERLLESDAAWQKSCDGWVAQYQEHASEPIPAEMESAMRRTAYAEAAAEIETLRAALLAERERCAVICDKIGEAHLSFSKMGLPIEPSPIIARDRNKVAQSCAEAIRKEPTQ